MSSLVEPFAFGAAASQSRKWAERSKARGPERLLTTRYVDFDGMALCRRFVLPWP